MWGHIHCDVEVEVSPDQRFHYIHVEMHTYDIKM